MTVVDTGPVDAVLAQHGGDRLGDRDDLYEGPVAQRRHDPHLRVVDPPRDHGRDMRELRGKTAEDVRAAPAVAVHEVRRRRLQELHEPVGERQVEVARAEEVADGDAGEPGGRIHTGPRRANERAVVAAREQRVEQVDDLLRPAVQMAPGLDMQYLHRPIIM